MSASVPGRAAAGRNSKQRRLRTIVDLVRRESIETQEQLAGLLQAAGFVVTQATVSRDVRELHLVKVAVDGGRFRYGLPGDNQSTAFSDRILQLLRDFVLSVDTSENLVVLNTLPATAAGVAEAIDRMGAPEVIGTLAGERTVLIIIKPKSAVATFLRRLGDVLHDETRAEE